MIYFLYGENNFSIKKAYEKIIEKVDAEKVVFDFDEIIEFGDFYQHTQNNSLFSTKKIIVLFNFIEKTNADFKDRFLAVKDSIEKSSNIFIFIEYGLPRKNGKVFTWLVKNSKSQEYKLLTPGKIRQWAEKKFEGNNVRIDEDALQYLLDVCGKDLGLLENEINKVSAYGNNISIKIVKKMTLSSADINIFSAIDSLLKGDRKKTIALFRKSLKGGQSPQAILALAATQVRNLLAIKEGDYTAMKLHPFVVQKSRYIIEGFRLEDLKYIYKKILQFDLETKTGKLDSEVSLELLANLF